MDLPVEIRSIMEKMNSTTYNHSLRVWELALEVEAHFQMTDEVLSTAALVHDIGKYYIPERILDRHEGLSPLERDVIDLHPYLGYRILEDYKVGEAVKRIVLYHHGMKPRLLAPLPEFYSVTTMEKAKMLHTIDAFEALTTDRPYRRRMSVGRAATFLEGQEGYHSRTLLYLKENVPDFQGMRKG